MNYKFDLQELDAEQLQAPLQPTEEREDYDARLAAAKGKHVIRLAALDDETSTEDKASIMVEFSPYYDAANSNHRFNMLARALKKIGRQIAEREIKKAEQAKVEPNLIIEASEMPKDRPRNGR